MAKKYSLIVENDKVESVEVDGVTYKIAARIPNRQDRERMQRLITAWSPPARGKKPVEADDPGIMQKIILPLFLGVSLLMFGLAAIFGMRAARSLTGQTTTQGHVVRLIERKNSEGSIFYYPVVEFRLPDNSLVTAPLAEGSWPPAYREGEQVEIAYNPAQPLDARIPSRSGTIGYWTVPIITGILGVAFLGATILAWWIFRQEPPEWTEESDEEFDKEFQ